LFTGQNIDDTITTSCSSAVGSAGGIGVVAVASALIAFFTDLDDTISALRSALSIASVVGSIQSPIIAFFIRSIISFIFIGVAVTTNGD